MEPDKTAGTWSTLAVNERRAIVATFDPLSAKPDSTVPKRLNNQGYPERLAKVAAPSELKKISTDDKGIHIPAVACTNPNNNTEKIVFMNTREGGMNLHFKLWEMPQPLVYEIEVASAGNYPLTANNFSW